MELIQLAPLLLLACAFMVAAGAQGATGLGFSLVALPIAAMVLGPDEVVGTVVRAALLLDVMVVVRLRSSLDVRALRDYGWPALFGVPVGLGLGHFVPQTTLVALSASVCLVMGGWLIAQSRVGGRAIAAMATPGPAPVPIGATGGGRGAGFASGLMAASVGMPGPPLALDAVRRIPVAPVRNATLAAFFVVADLVAVLAHPAHLGAGRMTGLAVAVVLGAVVGLRLQARIAAERLQQAMLVLVVASSAVAVVTIAAPAVGL